MRHVYRWFSLAVILAAGLTLSACGGEIASDLPGNPELDGGGEQVEFSGIVESIADAKWTVSGISFGVAENTEITGDLGIGDEARVRARLADSGDMLAIEIERMEVGDQSDASSSDDDDELEFIGVVESMDDESWTVAGSVIAITSQTEIKGSIAVGDVVKVHALDSENGLIAREIELASQEVGEATSGDDLKDHEEELVGSLESIEGDVWTVSAVSFRVTSSTEIKGNPAVGDLVKVHLVVDGEGNLLAREIELAEGDELQSAEDDDLDDDGDEADDHDDRDDGDHDEDDEDRSGSNSGPG